jgi:mono/diheme cytochrome c family protein
MTRGTPLALLLVASVVSSAFGQWTAGERRAAIDYMQHCSGCHGMDGAGSPSHGVPDFRGQIGHLPRLPEGRAFLMQVPGLLNSGLSDERRAAVTTWLILRFAGASLPPEFQPYTADEARRYRETRPADITAVRRRVYAELVAAGFLQAR